MNLVTNISGAGWLVVIGLVAGGLIILGFAGGAFDPGINQARAAQLQEQVDHQSAVDAANLAYLTQEQAQDLVIRKERAEFWLGVGGLITLGLVTAGSIALLAVGLALALYIVDLGRYRRAQSAALYWQLQSGAFAPPSSRGQIMNGAAVQRHPAAALAGTAPPAGFRAFLADLFSLPRR